MFIACIVTVVVLCIFYSFAKNSITFNRVFVKIYNDGPLELVLWVYRCITIYFHQRLTPTKINDFNPNSTSLRYCGIVPTEGDSDMEANKLTHDKCIEDSIFIWGGDKNCRFVIAKITHFKHGGTYANLFVGDGTGKIYSLPKDTPVLGSLTENSWRANGLLLECIEPMRSWRLKFNGELVHDSDEGYAEQSVMNCRIDFLWKALKKPVDIWNQTSFQLLADSMPTKDLVNFLNCVYIDGYDQWGALHGTMSFGDQESECWYLRGQRQHRFRNYPEVSVTEGITIWHYFSNGDMLYLENCIRGSPISKYILGYYLTSSGSYQPIKRVSMEVQHVDNIPALVVTFSVNSEDKQNKYVLKTELNSTAAEHKRTKLYTNINQKGWSLLSLVKGTNIDQTVSAGDGLRIATTEEVPTSSLVFSLGDKNCRMSSITGGKGSSLACLVNLASNTRQHDPKFKVPDGLVVTTASWLKQLENNSVIGNEITNLQKYITEEYASINEIKTKCQNLVSSIENVAVSNEVTRQITLSMESLFPIRYSPRRFAVRSSACGEDGSESSSAGQNKTILGCPEEADFKSVIKAVAECWASQFTYQSVEYRRQRGQPLKSDMAVVIQEMVMPSVAGVVFTNDPTNGRTNSIVITANYGLGESVVSASTEPDTVYVARDLTGNLKISKMVIGDKKEKIIMKGHSGTESICVDFDKSKEQCLLEQDILQLADTAVLIETAYASPRDIEFAFYNETLYILQARPITTLEAWTDYELIHESDKAVITDNELFTIANAGEVFPGYMDPLTMSLVPKMLDLAIQKDFCMREWPFYNYDPVDLRTMATFSNRCMVNMGEMIYRGLDEKISAVNHAVDLSVFGRLVTSPKIHSWAKKRYGVMGSFVKCIRLGYAFYDFMFNTIRIKRSKGVYDVYNIEKEDVTAAAYYEVICRRLPEIMKICENHCHTSSASALSQCLALIVLSEGSDEITPEMIQNIAALFECISDTESGDVPTALEELSSAICDSGKAEEFANLTSEQGGPWLMNQSAPVADKFKEFIATHGHRGLKEFFFTSMSWETKPEILMTSLKQMVKNKRTLISKRKKNSLEETFESLSGNLKPSTKRALKFLLGLCGTSVSQRETTKSMTIRTFGAFKKAYRHLALLMVQEFRLPDANLIYFLTHYEIGLLLKNRSAYLVTKAIRRRRLMKSIENLYFPEISIGVPVPSQAYEEENIVIAYGNEVYYGTPVCFGRVTGAARVVKRLEDADQIQIGEILITKSTDVGWTPYFPLLGGIVTEIGGLISHGAVVAREYGLPCIVGLKNATSLFNSGDMVFLDGKEGSIRKHIG